MTRLPFLALALAACATAKDPAAVRQRGGAALQPIDVALLRTGWTPQQIQAVCDEAEKVTDAKLLQMAALPADQRTFANTVDVLEQVTTDYGDAVGRATFMKDIAGLATRHLIGPENILWASDYPHADSTWPHSQQVIAEQFAGVPEAEKRLITRDNAARLYGFLLEG